MADEDHDPRIVNPGRFVRRDRQGRVHEVGPGGTPDYTICRRLRDFTHGMPEGAAVTACDRCGCAIVTANRFPDRPVICFQCAGILPLPLPEAP